MNDLFCIIASVLVTGIMILINKKLNIIEKNKYILYGLILLSVLIISSVPIFVLGIRKIVVIGYLLIYIFLVLLAIYDLKEQSVPVILIYLLWTVCAVIMILNPFIKIMNNLATGGVMTIICIIIYKLSKKRIGIADVKIIAGLSFALGYPMIFSQLFYSMFLAMIYGIVLMLRKKANSKTEIPFLPFMAIGFVLNVINF